MKILGIFVGVFALVAFAFGISTHLSGFYLLFAFGAICAATTFCSGGVSAYLKVFVAIFAGEYILFGLPIIARHVSFLPQLPENLTMPVTAPLTVAMFAIAVFGIAYVPVVRRTTVIADRFFEAREKSHARIWPLPAYRADQRTIAIAMVVFLVVVNQLQVVLNLLLSFFGRDFVNALNAKDAPAFWYQLLVVFPVLAFPYIASQVIEFVVQSTLIIRWREWLTNFYAGRWLTHHAHYRMSLAGHLADNPDQRISEDVIRFINGYGTANGIGIYTISIQLIAKFSNLVSFAILLWTLSAGFTFPGSSFAVPGFLFWCALIYAGIGTIATHVLGRRLRPLSFTRQRFEADFRFSLARMREYGEQIALLKGEPTEQAVLTGRFGAIVTNYFQIVNVRKILMGFTGFYGQLNPFIPYIVSAPFYFLGKITYGVLNQIATAFGNVSDALTIFIDFYVQLAEYQSVVDRLGSFDKALALANTAVAAAPVEGHSADPSLVLENVTLRLPDGHALLSNVNVTIVARENLLLTGPSGSGKSSLFRAISGIWPYTSGTVMIPAGETVMVLPQRPYFPIGTLRTAATYPSAGDAYDEAAVVAALRAVRLDSLVDKLDIEDAWTQRLSGGEQQRLAIARAMLARPDWLLLDEATSAMDMKLEAKIYETLAVELPKTTILSIAHRPSLMDHHAQQVDMQTIGADGRPALVSA